MQEGDIIADLISRSNPVETPQPETPVEPTPTPQPEPGQAEGFSFSTAFGERYKSQDDVKAAIERSEKYSDEVLSELENLRQEAPRWKEVQSEYEKLKNANPYKTVDYYRLEKIAESSPDELPVFQKVVFGNPDNLEMVKLDFLRKNPEYKDNPAVVDRYVARKFPALFNPDVTTEDQDYKDAMLDLEIEAKTIKKDLRGRLDAINPPDYAKEQSEKKVAQEKFTSDWSAALNESVKDFGKMPVEVVAEGGKGKEVVFDMEIPMDANYVKQTLSYAVQNNIPLTKENVSMLKGMMKKLWVFDHFDEYNTSLAEHVSKAKDGKWRAKVNNPETTPAQRPEGSLATDPSKDLLTQIMKEY